MVKLSQYVIQNCDCAMNDMYLEQYKTIEVLYFTLMIDKILSIDACKWQTYWVFYITCKSCKIRAAKYKLYETNVSYSLKTMDRQLDQ